MTCDLTCIITGHREGRIAVPSLRSFWIAIEAAREAGYKVEALLYLDRPNDLTAKLFESYKGEDNTIATCDVADQGEVRNYAVNNAKGTYCAFLDADDLWTKDWLVKALEFLSESPEAHIAHPEYNYFFEKSANIYKQVDQESPEFRLDTLRWANYWDALCMCRTEIYLKFPFCSRNIAGGYAYEDWHWNCETVAAGYIHKVVPKTVLFKRRQGDSQTMKAGANGSLTRRHDLLDYSHPIYTAGGGSL
jgi:glycosyltransferase involved in cell wall biosynthesis